MPTNIKMKQGIATLFLFLTFVLLIFVALIFNSTAPGSPFEGWFGKTLAPSEYLGGEQTALFATLGLFLFVCIMSAILWSQAKISPFLQKYGDIILGGLGLAILFSCAYIPQLFALPLFDKWTPSPGANFYLKVAAYPGIMILPGIALLIMAAPEKWAAFRNSFLGAIVFTCLAMPVVRICYPDLYFETEVAYTIGIFLVCYVGAFCLHGTMLPYLFPPPPADFTPDTLDLDVSPEKGHTVRAIIENRVETPPRKRFLFGTVDEELILQWGLLGKAIVTMSTRLYKRAFYAVIFLLVYPLVVFEISGGDRGAFQRDVPTMWQTTTLPDGQVVATRRAMTAAKRVLNNGDMIYGLTKEEAKERLGIKLMNPAYKLNRPSYSWQDDQFIVRIGDGKNSYALVAAFDINKTISLSWPVYEPFPKKEKPPAIKRRPIEQLEY